MKIIDKYTKQDCNEDYAKFIKQNVKDPRNITSYEWELIDSIYNSMNSERWEDIIKIACANNENIKKGSGENKKSAENFRRKIGK